MRSGWKIFWIICGITLAIGFACCAVSLGMGVTLDSLHDRFPNGIGWVREDGGRLAEDIHESYKGITEIDAELFAGNVSVFTTDGDEVRVETNNLRQKLGFKCYTEGNELKLRTNKKLYHINNVGKGTIKIYIPREMIFEEASFYMGAGELYIERIFADSFLTSVGAGEVDIDGFWANEAELECGAGSIQAKGDIASEIEITCGVGEIQYTASGDEKEYNYDIECAIGEVVCGSNKYSGINGEKNINNHADKDMNISNGVGSVIVEFNGIGIHHDEHSHE